VPTINPMGPHENSVITSSSFYHPPALVAQQTTSFPPSTFNPQPYPLRNSMFIGPGPPSFYNPSVLGAQQTPSSQSACIIPQQHLEAPSNVFTSAISHKRSYTLNIDSESPLKRQKISQLPVNGDRAIMAVSNANPQIALMPAYTDSQVADLPSALHPGPPEQRIVGAQLEGLKHLREQRQNELRNALQTAQRLSVNLTQNSLEVDHLRQQQIDSLTTELRNVRNINANLQQEIVQREKSSAAASSFQEAIIEELKLQIIHDREVKESLAKELQGMQQWVQKLESLRAEYDAKARIECAIGLRVLVQSIDASGVLSLGKYSSLTEAILTQMKQIKDQFSKKCPNHTICKIEYIMNKRLYNQFDLCKQALRKSYRPTFEEIVFHGTPQRNIQRYKFTTAILIEALLLRGFESGV